jgi:hypothetical protein
LRCCGKNKAILEDKDLQNYNGELKQDENSTDNLGRQNFTCV